MSVSFSKELKKAKLLHDLKKYNLAEEAFLKLYTLNQDNFDVNYYLYILLGLKKKDKQAKIYEENLLKNHFNNPKTYYIVGFVHLQEEDILEAESFFKKGMEIDPFDILCPSQLIFTSIQKGDYKAAHTYANLVLSIEPLDDVALSYKLQIYSKTKDISSDCQIIIKSLLENYSEDDYTHQTIADYYYATNNNTLALFHYEQALKLNPQNSYSKGMVLDLKPKKIMGVEVNQKEANICLFIHILGIIIGILLPVMSISYYKTGTLFGSFTLGDKDRFVPVPLLIFFGVLQFPKLLKFFYLKLFLKKHPHYAFFGSNDNPIDNVKKKDSQINKIMGEEISRANYYIILVIQVFSIVISFLVSFAIFPILRTGKINGMSKLNESDRFVFPLLFIVLLILVPNVIVYIYLKVFLKRKPVFSIYGLKSIENNKLKEIKLYFNKLDLSKNLDLILGWFAFIFNILSVAILFAIEKTRNAINFRVDGFFDVVLIYFIILFWFLGIPFGVFFLTRSLKRK